MVKNKLLKNNIMELSGGDDNILLLLSKVKRYVGKGFTILIVTALTFDELNYEIGVKCADKVGFENVVTDKIKADNDPKMYELVGKMTLDYYIPTEYYVQSTKEEILYTIKARN